MSERRTTIEITESTRESLRDARESYESNYDETIERLLDEDDGGHKLWTKAEIEGIAERVFHNQMDQMGAGR